MRPHPLERLFTPRAIAVVGAPGGEPVASRVLESLVAAGFPGPVHAVGIAGPVAPAGVRTCASLAEVEGDLDLAVLAAPAPSLPALVRACADRGVAGAILAPGAGREPRAAGEELSRALRAARGRVRLVGPGAAGIVRPAARLAAADLGAGAAPGSIALVAQSAAVCAAALDWAAAHRVGLSAVACLGDAVDVDAGEVLEYLAQDRSTRSVLLHVEAVRSARAFLSGLRVAARAKPVVVVKADRHGRPGAGADDAFDAALARTGAVRVPSVERMLAAAPLLATPRAVGGNRLAVVTNARGPGLLAADRAADLGLRLAPLSDATRRALGTAPSPGAPAGPVELPGDADPAAYRAAVERCLADPEVDGVLAVLAPLGGARPEETAAEVVLASRGSPKPVLACWMGAERVRGARARLVEAGLPALSSPEAAVEAFALLATHARNQRLLRQVPRPLAPDAVPDLDRARQVVEGALARGRRELGTAELRRLLATVGVRDGAAAGQRVRGAEVRVSVTRDAVVGPVLRLGRPGPCGDAVVALPPLDTAIVRTLLEAGRGSGALGAAGGMPPASLAACERLLWSLSELVSELPELRELEAPLVVAGGDVYAAGARATIAPPVPGAPRYAHMAIHPYPRDVGARWDLPGGAVVTVRPIRPEDAEAEASFVRNLSDTARHHRFLSGVRELTREMLFRFTQLDYDRELALVAVVERGGEATQIAVARYVRADAESAEVSIVVADEWQGRGIGARLLGLLLDAARARGFSRAEAEVLAENAPVRALLAGLGFSFRRHPDDPALLLVERSLK